MVTEFWNIPNGLVKGFYALAFVTIIIFFLGFWDKLKIWSRGMDADQELKGMGPIRLIWLSITKFFSSDCLFAKRVFPRSVLRALMLIGIMWGFTILLLGTGGRSINYYFFQFLEGSIWLLFSLILDIAGILVLIGTGFGLYRKYIGKPERMVKSTQDGILLSLLFLVVLSGFFVEGIRIAVTNPPAADWSPVGLVFGAITQAIVGAKGLNALHVGVWTIHFLLAFSFIAYIPFSKYEHIFASQISTYLFEEKWKDKEIPRDWVFTEDIAKYKSERLNSVNQETDSKT
jgi:nitrate reductase gamma subunit